MNDSEFQTIDSCDLDDVNGGRGGIVRAAKWLWKQADRGLTAIGAYEAGQAVYDWATGANQQPQQPQQPQQGQGGAGQ